MVFTKGLRARIADLVELMIHKLTRSVVISGGTPGSSLKYLHWSVMMPLPWLMAAGSAPNQAETPRVPRFSKTGITMAVGPPEPS